MPKLPHIKNSQVAQDVAEDLSLNRFEALITPPAGIPVVNWLADEIKTIGGLDVFDKTPEMKIQKSRGHDRVFYDSFLDTTVVDLAFTLNLNAHGPKANDIMIYKMFKSWQRRIRNESNGATGLKRNTYGTLVLEQHNKIGEVWRRIDSSRFFFKDMSGLDEASLESGEPVVLTVNFTSEEHTVDYGGDALAI